ncbi:MAG: restriction endonuclease subunit S [Bacteroidetes bacterium]|nr:restriction endonuclease subunit S [Bacteroidota bacterium]
MSRGRKPVSNFNGSEWETVFYNSVGTYVQYINIQLSKVYKLEPLSNHLKIIGGYAFKTAKYKSQGIPIIRISDFNNEQIVLNDVVYYEESKELDKYQLIEGDIIIALTGGTIAKLAKVQSGLGKIYLNQRVGKFQALNPAEFEVEYIYWLARSIQNIIKNLAWGAAIPNVSPKQIEELKFPFPKKEVQRGIIDFLNDLKNNCLIEDKIYFDELVEGEIILLHERQLTTSSISTELTHQLTLVKKLRQQLLQDAVQGKLVEQNLNDEPASELLKKIKAEKAKLITEKKFKKEKELAPIKPEEIPFEIPENWVWCRLGDLALYSEAGKSYQALEIAADENKIGVIKTSAITSGVFIEGENKLLPNQDLNIDKIKIKIGDLIFCRASGSKGLAGKSCLVLSSPKANLILSDKSIRYVFSDNVNKVFLQFINTSIYGEEYYLSLGTKKSTTMNNITREQFDCLPIPLPPLSEQSRIVQKLDELMQYCNELEASIKQSEAQNEKLMQQVLREALKAS